MNLSGLAAVVLLGAFLVLQDPTEQGPAAALARAEAQWQSRGPKSYKFGVILSCFCFPKGMSFRVVDGKPQLPRGADASTQRFHESWGTVELLFARIRRVIDNGGHRVVVRYHTELGYPIWADLDPRRDVIDDELFFRVSGFQKLDAPVQERLFSAAPGRR
jgi:hypothetical protein